MATGKVFWSGRSQAIRVPKEFRFDTAELRIRRHGNAVVLEPIAADWDWLDARQARLDANFVEAALAPVADQVRPELDFLA